MGIGDIFKTPAGPRQSKDLTRILDLPQRNAEELGAQIAELLSRELRAPNGTQTLRPLQAIGLAEAYDLDGALFLLPVGGGKTLVSFLLPTIMEAERPLLIVPGKLRQKTAKEFRELETHWKRPKNLTIASYEEISVKPNFMDSVKPDLIIMDESHKLKNRKAVCTKRVWKYWHSNDDIKVIPMSGTLAKRSFFDWWHLQAMALPDYMGVLPYNYKELEHWCRALDEKNRDRCGLGALEVFGKNLDEARAGYGELLKRVPGVIAADTMDIDASIYISSIKFEDPIITEALNNLRDTWELPDGTEIMEATDMWRHSRELANGFYYRWKDEAPIEWREARRIFNAKIRQALQGSRKWEAPAQAVEALRDEPDVKAWLDIKPTFVPETEAVWLTDSVLKRAVDALCMNNGIIWYGHKAVGEKLSQMLPTYGSQGQDIRTGKSIVDASGQIAASIKACCEGFNLQKWDRNIMLQFPSTGDTAEQLLGRTHRFGQKADTIEVTLITTCMTQENDFNQALADARYIEATTGQRQKMTLADVIDS